MKTRTHQWWMQVIRPTLIGAGLIVVMGFTGYALEEGFAPPAPAGCVADTRLYTPHTDKTFVVAKEATYWWWGESARCNLRTLQYHRITSHDEYADPAFPNMPQYSYYIQFPDGERVTMEPNTQHCDSSLCVRRSRYGGEVEIWNPRPEVEE
jgi:hypothetical protein